MSAAIQRLAEEDPSLTLRHNQDSGETVLSGHGEMHLRVTVERLEGKNQIPIEVPAAGSPLSRDDPQVGVSQRGRHKKQSGGHGQFGDVVIEIKPLPRGSGFKFTDTITGGVVPKQYIQSVETGIRDYLKSGPLGFPVVDIAVNLSDGSYHAVDSSDMAFQMAASIGMKEGMAQCSPVLLEPIMKVEIATPSEATAEDHRPGAAAARPDPRLRRAARLAGLGRGRGDHAAVGDRRPDHRAALGDGGRRELPGDLRPHGRTDRPACRPGDERQAAARRHEAGFALAGRNIGRGRHANVMRGGLILASIGAIRCCRPRSKRDGFHSPPPSVGDRGAILPRRKHVFLNRRRDPARASASAWRRRPRSPASAAIAGAPGGRPDRRSLPGQEERGLQARPLDHARGNQRALQQFLRVRDAARTSPTTRRTSSSVPGRSPIDGLVEKPFTIAFDDLVRKIPLETRLYRHRCVEAWSMTVPVGGFPAEIAGGDGQAAGFGEVRPFRDLPRSRDGGRPEQFPVSVALCRRRDHRGGRATTSPSSSPAPTTSRSPSSTARRSGCICRGNTASSRSSRSARFPSWRSGRSGLGGAPALANTVSGRM